MNLFDIAFGTFRSLLHRLIPHFNILFAVCLLLQIVLCAVVAHLAFFLNDVNMLLVPVCLVAMTVVVSPRPRFYDPGDFPLERIGSISSITILSFIIALGSFAAAAIFTLGGADISFWTAHRPLYVGLLFLMASIFGFFLAVRETRLLQDE